MWVELKFRTYLLTRSWATDLSTAKYWTDPEKS